MTARAKKGFPAIHVMDVSSFRFSTDARTAIAKEFMRHEKPDDVEQAIDRLQAHCQQAVMPWERPIPPSAAVRKSGLKQTARLAKQLEAAIKNDGLIGADFQAVNQWQQLNGCSELYKLERELHYLNIVCLSVAAEVKKETPRAAERFDEAADAVGTFYRRVLGKVPTIRKLGSSYLAVLRICCEEMRGKRTTEGQVIKQAKALCRIALIEEAKQKPGKAAQ